MKPIIGILSCEFTQNRHYVPDPYIKAVHLSGGVPLIIPMIPPVNDPCSSPSPASSVSGELDGNFSGLIPSMQFDFSPYLTLCHGFLLPGGGDFTPLLFGETPVYDIGETDIAFDLFQIQFARSALATKKPILGICRGMQVMNASCGGTIYQDLSLQPEKPHLHMQNSRSRSDVSHLITVSPGSILSGIVGSRVAVNSFHHQSIHAPGEHVKITARASDHTAEALEISGHPFALGVQWHPEAMFDTSAPMRSLFSIFIQKAGA